MTAVPAGSTSTPPSAVERRPPEPITLGARPTGNDVVVKVFVVVPFLALLATLPFAWGWGLTGARRRAGGGLLPAHPDRDHGRLPPPLHPPLVQGRPRLSGSSWPCWAAWRCRGRSSPGSPTTAATTPSPTRRATRTRPWLFGTTPAAVARGFWHAHFGWMLRPRPHQPGAVRPRPARRPRHRPDQPAVPRVDGDEPGRPGRSRRSAQLVVVGRRDGVLLGRAGPHRRPAPRHLVGQLDLPHDRRPALDRRDRSTNFWPLAIVSFGESWHNLHHADPTCARHGVGRGQIDISARIIAIFERLGWAYDVRWPTPGRLARLAASRDRQGR